MDDELGLFAIADGMGGHSYGEVAAELALASLQDYVRSSRSQTEVTWPFGYDADLSPDENRLATAIQVANRRVYQRSERTPEYAGMGTTLSAVLVRNDQAAVASVGDSRVYLFRDGKLTMLTMDDTWVGAMVRQGSLDARDASYHPMRNVLTQAAGAREHVDVQTLECRLVDRDMLLISSDGLHGVVEEGMIRAVLGDQTTLEASARLLIDAARDRGAPDNVSCVLLRYEFRPAAA